MLERIPLFWIGITIFLIVAGIILPIRWNYVQGSLGKKVFWISVSLMLVIAVYILEDRFALIFVDSWGSYRLFGSAAVVSACLSVVMLMSDEKIARLERWSTQVFFGLFLGVTILSLLFDFKSLRPLQIGIGIYTLVLGAVELAIVLHRKKQIRERELRSLKHS